MKKYMLPVLVIFCTAMIGIAIAQETTKQEQKPEKAPPATMTGEVVSVDPAKNEIVIKDDAGVETHLLIATSTKITREGKGIALGDVKAGDRVVSVCEPSADGCKAKSIMVTPPQPNQ
jgi:hypothetical protein